MNLKNPEVIDATTLPALFAYWNRPALAMSARYGRHAEDAVATAWAKVVEHGAMFRPGAEFRPWFMTLVANAARDAIRAGKRRDGVSLATTTETGDSIGSLIADPMATDPSDSARIRDIRAAIAALPAAQGEIIRLAMAGRDYAAIAEILGIPVGTVKSRLNAARAALAVRLAE